ncbi:MAG: hypothetical protein LAP21_19900 [Acidobacteriia bacterium]|nr:hypothetical protein [Terriglobia bacterium]
MKPIIAVSLLLLAATFCLINAGRQFDLMLYPRKTHGIGGPQARIHLFNRIRDHFHRELLGSEAPKTE